LPDMPSKVRVLLRALDGQRVPETGRIKGTVIFTRFYDTLTDIVNRLRQIDPHMLIGTYSGKGGQYVNPRTWQMTGVERDEIKHRFLRGEIDVLVCTDAAAEGLNLQRANFLINFDLPWNPMKVEQRIGRIDRIGQKHEEVRVLNLCYADSAEQIVYDRLLNRLAEADRVVGRQQFSMLPVTVEEFQQLADGSLSESELERLALERMERDRQRTARMEIPAEDMYEIYARLKEECEQQPLPVDLSAIWKALTHSAYLRDLGCVVSSDSAKPTLLLFGIDDAPDKTALTTSRTLYEQGVPELEGRLHFASYGDPTFAAVVNQVCQYELPLCVKRLSEKTPDSEAEVVAYAVACQSDGGVKKVKLVTSYADLADTEIDEGTELTEEDVAPLQDKLQEAARQEVETARAVNRIESANVAAGRSQIALDYLVIESLISFRRGMVTDGENFWAVVRDIEEIVSERDELSISSIPAEQLRTVAEHVPFEMHVPQAGATASIMVPAELLRPALDAACRIADSMRVKKADLSTNRVVERLRREVDRAIRLVANTR